MANGEYCVLNEKFAGTDNKVWNKLNSIQDKYPYTFWIYLEAVLEKEGYTKELKD